MISMMQSLFEVDGDDFIISTPEGILQFKRNKQGIFEQEKPKQKMPEWPIAVGNNLFASVSEEDWSAAYAACSWFLSGGRPTGYIEGKNISLHAFIFNRMGLILKDGETIDHKDQNPLNNKRDNLRAATQTQQNLNQTHGQFKTSLYYGVHWVKQSQKWVARVHKRGRIHLGYFECEVEAAEVYDKAALIHHGPDARLNFPEKLREYLDEIAFEELIAQ